MSDSIALPGNPGICLHRDWTESQRTCSTHLSKSGQRDPFPEKVLPSLQWESITPSHCILFELLLGKLFFCWTTKNPGWLHVYSFANHSAILNPIYPLRLTQMMDLATNHSLPMRARTHTYTPLFPLLKSDVNFNRPNQLWCNFFSNYPLRSSSSHLVHINLSLPVTAKLSPISFAWTLALLSPSFTPVSWWGQEFSLILFSSLISLQMHLAAISSLLPGTLPEVGTSALRSHKPIWNLSSLRFPLPGSQSPETPFPGPAIAFIHKAFPSNCQHCRDQEHLI